MKKVVTYFATKVGDFCDKSGECDKSGQFLRQKWFVRQKWSVATKVVATGWVEMSRNDIISNSKNVMKFHGT